MDGLVSYIRSIQTVDEWQRFVDSKGLWQGKPEIIRELEYKWLAFSCVDPDLDQQSNRDFWDAIRVLNRKRGSSPSPSEPPPKRNDGNFVCQLAVGGVLCNKSFSSNAHLVRHQRYSHNPDAKKHKCDVCGKAFRDSRDLKQHKCRPAAPPVPPPPPRVPARLLPNLSQLPQSADVGGFRRDIRRRNGALTIVRFTPLEPTEDYDQVLQDISPLVEDLIQRGLAEYSSIKYQLKLLATFYKEFDVNEKGRGGFGPKAITVLPGEVFIDDLQKALKITSQWIVEFLQNGSGWVIQSVDLIDIVITGYNPIGGGSFIPSPRKLRKCLMNIQNEDHKCFMWCILASLHPTETDNNSNRVNNYVPYVDELSFDGIPFPVALEHVGKFEQLNNLAVNIYGYQDDNGLHPLRLTKRRDYPESIIHLLRLEDGDNIHYCLVRSLDRLLYHIHAQHNHLFHCPFCLFHFSTEERRQRHIPYCQTGDQAVEMPEDGETLKFRNVKNQMRAPLLIYADFESFLAPVEGCQQNPALSSTMRLQQHIPNSFAAICKKSCGCSQTYFKDFVLYRGNNSPTQFMEYCIRQGEEFQRQYDNVQQIVMSQSEKKSFRLALVCSICGGPFEEDDVKAKDHCHICGRYRGAAHLKCNLDFRQQRNVSVVIHNLRRYDAHLIMQELGEVARHHKADIECVPKGFEDYLTFSLTFQHKLPSGQRTSWKLRFIDSCQFLMSSLDSLSSSLLGKDGVGEAKFLALKQKFPNKEDRLLLLRKGVYPYEFVDKEEKFQLKELPAQEKFYSSLKGESITDVDYQHAQNVWNHFKCADFGQYHDLYLTTDVLLLADVFESFRQNSLSHYNLDPAHYITLPSFAWDACLKFSKVELELLSDPDMYQFFESSIRGGVSMITGRHAKANNPLLEGYDPNVECSYIKYYDANNLYGWSMSQPLPLSEFQWLSEDEIQRLDVANIPDDDSNGFVLEVDLDYPVELHNTHSDYPLAPESLIIRDEMLSEYSLRLRERFSMTASGEVKKLTPNLFHKRNYVVHYRNLKFYMSLGMVLRRIHRGLSFKQAPWMRSYIEFNTRQRAQATSSFEKDFFKLLNNAVFGKSMENVRKYKDIKVVADEQKLRKLVANPAFEEVREFGGKLYAVSLATKVVKLNKPIYTGFCVLDSSKLVPYEFHYNYILPKFGERATLLFTDTDSLCYSFKTDDIYKDIAPDAHLFDFSDYPKDHFLFSETNKKVIGKMKDETNGVPVEEFVGLRAKMYSFKVGGKEKKRGKGIAKAVVEKNIRHADYVNALFNQELRRDTMYRIQSEGHQLHTVRQVKVSLCCFDNKRYIMPNGVDTLALGHFATIRAADVTPDVAAYEEIMAFNQPPEILVTLTRKYMYEISPLKRSDVDLNFHKSYNRALREMGIFDKPGWKDASRILLGIVENATTIYYDEETYPPEELIVNTKMNVDQQLKSLNCQACTYDSCSQLNHMFPGGCLSTIEEKLGAIEFEAAYMSAAETIAKKWMSAVKSEVFARIVKARKY